MKTHRGWRILVVVGMLVFGFGASLPAAELTGDYDDAGTTIETAPGEEAAPSVSFYALLAQDFVPVSAKAIAAAPAKVEFRQSADFLAITIRDEKGKVVMRGEWRNERDYVVEDGGVNFRFPSTENRDNRIVYSFTPNADGKMLRVRIWRVEASVFGPVTRRVGEYWFGRL